MTAIYKRELKSFFYSLTGWLYIAVMMFMMGLYFTLCNMLAGYATISYVLQIIVFLIMFTIPILTMRSLSEERKYKTDQLILTAPISVGKIVMGKYLALVTVFAIPLAILGLTPLALMRAGEFQIGLSYTSLLGFFLYGCLGLAVGLFLSSLTESVVIAAVLALIAMFVGYIMGGLCSVISTSGTTAFADFMVKILYCFDMVGRFDILCSGYFEVEAVAYYVTCIFFVLFCTAQSIQKRRYAMAGRGIAIGAYSIFNILVAAVLTIVVNLGLNLVPDQYVSYDVTENRLFTLTEDTLQYVQGMTQDVTIYVLVNKDSKDEDLDRTLQQLENASDYIHVEYVSPISNPMFYYKYTDIQPATNSLIVVSGNADAIVDYDDIYEYGYDYSTGNYENVGYDGEGQILSALTRVEEDNFPKFYVVTGHEELEFDERFLDVLDKENMEYETLHLNTVDAVPEDAQCIILNAPINDYSTDDVNKVLAYLEQGGSVLVTLAKAQIYEGLPNFEQIIGYYGVSIVDGAIVETNRSHYYQTPYDLFPIIEYDEITQRIYDGTVFAPMSRGLSYDADSEDIRYRPLLMTSDEAFSKTDVLNLEDYLRSEADTAGPFVIALETERPTESGEVSQAVIVSTEYMFTAEVDDIVPGYNVKLFGSILASLASRDTSVVVPIKYYELPGLVFSAQTVYIVAFSSIIILPSACLIFGLVIMLRRRKR